MKQSVYTPDATKIVKDAYDGVRLQSGEISARPRTVLTLPPDTYVQLNDKNELCVHVPSGEFSEKFVDAVLGELGTGVGEDVLEYARVAAVIDLLKTTNL